MTRNILEFEVTPKGAADLRLRGRTPRILIVMVVLITAVILYAAAGLAGLVPWRTTPGSTVASGAWLVLAGVVLVLGTRRIRAAEFATSRRNAYRFEVDAPVEGDGVRGDLLDISVGGAAVRFPQGTLPPSGFVPLRLPRRTDGPPGGHQGHGTAGRYPAGVAAGGRRGLGRLPCTVVVDLPHSRRGPAGLPGRSSRSGVPPWPLRVTWRCGRGSTAPLSRRVRTSRQCFSQTLPRSAHSRGLARGLGRGRSRKARRITHGCRGRCPCGPGRRGPRRPSPGTPSGGCRPRATSGRPPLRPPR